MKLAPLPDLACQDVVELVTDYLERALDDENRARVEQHLLVCPPCSAYLAQMKRSVELLARLRGEAEPSEVAPELLRAFRERKPK
jgi:anti-sigma factor RsiW